MPRGRTGYGDVVIRYLLLVAPSANRVYAADAPALVAAETRALLTSYGEVGECAVRTIAGVRYIAVEAGASDVVRMAIAHLSAVFAAFEVDGELLRPIELPSPEVYPDDLVSIQKYQGKTNEQWTRLCLNLTAAVTRRPERLLDRSLVVLDPMCGRGTTLNIAMSLGLNVIGADIDRRDFEAYEMFVKTWLRQHRLKHNVESTTLRRAGRALGNELTVTAAPTKEAFKAGDATTVTYLNTDTTALADVLRKASVDVIVTDTPYGVQHGSQGERLSRRPLELLATALPGWAQLLRTGGAIGLSINRHVAPVDELRELLRCNGLEPVDHGEDFRHRVDASIERDVIVAAKHS